MLLISAIQQSGNPEAEIRNEFITARLLLPDAENGYYRGTRFDWSGQIAHLEFDGHTYFGEWFDRYDPVLHDAIMGPVEEFGPLGYEEAKPGEAFVMIGIGALEKPVENAHNRFGYYNIVDHGTWKVQQKPDRVEFVHELRHGDTGYEYTKVVRLVPGKPEMELLHILKNTGVRPIRTNMYNHNFFVIDGQTTGTDFTVAFPYPIAAEGGRGFGTIADVRDNRIVFLRNLEKGETVITPSVTGFGDTAEDLDIRVENLATGAGVRITGDRPLSRVIFWAAHRTLSPETYIDLDVAPGEEFRWTFNYEFYTTGTK